MNIPEKLSIDEHSRTRFASTHGILKIDYITEMYNSDNSDKWCVEVEKLVFYTSKGPQDMEIKVWIDKDTDLADEVRVKLTDTIQKICSNFSQNLSILWKG